MSFETKEVDLPLIFDLFKMLNSCVERSQFFNAIGLCNILDVSGEYMMWNDFLRTRLPFLEGQLQLYGGYIVLECKIGRTRRCEASEDTVDFEICALLQGRSGKGTIVSRDLLRLAMLEIELWRISD